jgi:hypothetical protein
VHEKESWLQEALALVPQNYRDEIAESLAPLLKRCHSRSKKSFWQWLRLTLVKSEETAAYLEWMQERFTLPEQKSDPSDFRFEVNGDTVLIPVGNPETGHGVWKIPVQALSWAREQWPVFLRKLPPLESPERERMRELRRELRLELKRSPFLSKLTRDMRESFVAEIEDLEAQELRAYDPLPRYALLKSTINGDIALHRLFLSASPDQEIIAVDDDFLNFTVAKVTVIVEDVTDGYAACPRRESTAWVPNLQIVGASAAQQREFEENFLPIKTTLQGDISMRLPIQPNADLGRRAGCYGKVTDCGKFRPATVEQYSPERFASKVRNAWGIRRK